MDCTAVLCPYKVFFKKNDVFQIGYYLLNGWAIWVFLSKVQAYDPDKKPIVQKGIELSGEAGADLHADLAKYITDPSHDSNLRVVIDDIKPAAPWLSLSNQTELTGVVPLEAEGQRYELTTYANTAAGGSSESVTTWLKIAINEAKTPRFISTKPVLPLFYEGQSYQYDFITNNDVSPAYTTIPYHVELSKGSDNPSWLRIENNQLIADNIPSGPKSTQQIFITIKNIPGGESEVLPITLFIVKQ